MKVIIQVDQHQLMIFLMMFWFNRSNQFLKNISQDQK